MTVLECQHVFTADHPVPGGAEVRHGPFSGHTYHPNHTSSYTELLKGFICISLVPEMLHLHSCKRCTATEGWKLLSQESHIQLLQQAHAFGTRRVGERSCHWDGEGETERGRSRSQMSGDDRGKRSKTEDR